MNVKTIIQIIFILLFQALLASCGYTVRGTGAKYLKRPKMLYAEGIDHKNTAHKILSDSFGARPEPLCPGDTGIKNSYTCNVHPPHSSGKCLTKKHYTYEHLLPKSISKLNFSARSRKPVSIDKPGINNSKPVLENFGVAGLTIAVIGGTLAFFFTFLDALAIIIAVGLAAIIFGTVGLVRISKHPHEYWGRGFAIAAIIIGVAEVVFIGLVLVAFLWWASMVF